MQILPNMIHSKNRDTTNVTMHYYITHTINHSFNCSIAYSMQSRDTKSHNFQDHGTQKHTAIAGFTLIEVLFTLIILASVLTPLIVWQGTMVRAIQRYSGQLDTLFALRTFFLDARMQAMEKGEKTFSLTQEDKASGAKLSYVMRPIEKDEALRKFKHVKKELLTVPGKAGEKGSGEMIISFVYKPDIPEIKQ